MRTLTAKNPSDAASVIAAAIAASSIGALLYNVLPLYLGTMADSKHLENEQIGLIGTAFFLGFNVSGLSAYLWVRKFHWRSVALAMLPIVLLSYALSAWVVDYVGLLIITLMGGVGVGAFYTIGSTIVGDTSNPTRWYGVKTTMESALGTVVLLALPVTLIPKYGFAGTVAGMALLSLALLPLLMMLPPAWQKNQSLTPMDPTARSGSRQINRLAIFSAVMALLLFFAGNSAIWAFDERLGKLTHYSESSVGAVLAGATLCGVLGSFSVAAVGARVSPVRFFMLCCVILLISFFCLNHLGSFALYALGNGLYQAGWAAGVPLCMTVIAGFDHDGRYISLAVPALGVGSMIGPGVAGWLLQVSRPFSVVVFAAALVVAAGGLMLVARRVSRGQCV